MSGWREKRVWAAGFVLIALLVLATAALVGCGGDGDETTTTAASATTEATTAETTATTSAGGPFVIASTTSTQDTGLFDVLLPAFEEANPGCKAEVVAVGSGAAIKMGETGDADVLLVHSPAAEQEFMDAGFGQERRAVMYNDFVLVGPASDPAGIKGVATVAEALKKISEAEAPFLSRGDDSGTHAKEKTLWEAAAVTPGGTWYEETGQGMSATLRIASEKEGYTLADRGTQLTTAPETQLEIVVEGDEALFNPYSVITLKDAKNADCAEKFADWIVSPEGQEVIGSFGTEKFGQALFTPDAE